MKITFTKRAASIATAVLAAMAVPAIAVPSAEAVSASPAVSGSVAGVTMAQVGNFLLLAGQGGADNEGVYFQTVGSSTWAEVSATRSGTVNSPVSMAQLTNYGNDLIGMAAEGPNNTLNFWWQPLERIGSGPWYQEEIGGPGTTYSAPSIVQVGNEVVIAAEGINGGLHLWWQQIGSTAWNSSYQEQGDVCSAPTMAALTSAPGILGIAYTACDGFVTYLQGVPSTIGQSYQFVGNIGITSSPPTIAALDNGVTSITVAASNGLYSWTSSDAGTTALPNFDLVYNTAGEDPVYPGVSVAQLANGVAAMASRSEWPQESTGEYLQFFWSTDNGNTWHPEDVSDTDLSRPSLIPLVNSSGTHMVAIATEGPGYSADIYWQIVGSSTWHTVSFPAGTFGA